MSNPQSNESSSSNFLLPTLKSNHEVKGGVPGQWYTKGGRGAFKNIAQSLDIKEPGEDIKNVSAIPNMWARALSMEMALHDDRNKLREVMISQWEGMLAAIALAEVRGWNLKAELIDLATVNSLNYYGQGARQLANSLRKLAPATKENALYTLSDKDKSWEDIYVLRWNDKPVGATSPSTLIFPAEDGDWSGLPWWSPAEGKLRSPRQSITDEKDKVQLWLWLNRLYEQLNRDDGNEDAISRIQYLIVEFRDSFPKPNNQTLQLSQNSLFGETVIHHGSLIALNYSIAATSRGSNVKLVTTTRNPKIPAVIVDRPKLSGKWGEKPENVWIWDNINYGNWDRQNVAQLKRLWQDRVTLLQPDDLFLPELYYIEQVDAFTSEPETGKKVDGVLLPTGAKLLTKDTDPITPLLPLQPILLDYFTPEELIQIVEMQNCDEGVRVTLKFTLSGMGGQTRQYHLEREFPLKKENCKTDLPVLEVWPNFAANGWQDYYVFYSDGEAGNDTFGVDLNGTAENSHCFSEGRANYQIVRLQQFPRYICCVDGANKQMGLLLLPKPDSVNITNPKEWTVGVDFGTSFTHVAINDDGSFRPLELKSLSHSVTSSKTSVRTEALDEFFVREETMKLPLSSVLTARGSANNSGELRLILDGRIFIPTNPNDFNPSAPGICTGLKWSKDRKKETFLKHLALEIVAHAAQNNVRKIQWALSYPTAYSEDTIKKTYYLTWQGLIEKLQQTTGIEQIPPNSDTKKYYRTESLAIAQYFADVENKPFQRVTCIDMGGGTSDISIWESDRKPLVHQCSVKLAGRDLFSQILALYPDLANKHFEPRNLLTNASMRADKLDAKLDALLREQGETWLDNKPQNEEIFKEFQQIMAIGFSGLYYYVGILLKVLSEEKRYSGVQMTSVYMGGNGSRLLHWLDDAGRFDRDSKLNSLLSRMMAKGSGFDDIGIKTTLSNHPKEEVARGLAVDLRNQRLQEVTSNDDDILIAGEAYKLGDRQYSALARMDLPENISGLSEPEASEFEILPQFLYEFNLALKELKLTKLVKPLDETKPLNNDRAYKVSNLVSDNQELWTEVSGKMHSYLSEYPVNKSEAEIDPSFILALKSLINVLAERWAAKWKRLDS